VAERNRLARDLHDSAKQQAFAASAQISAALARLEADPKAAQVHLHEAEQLVFDVRQELTDLIQELHPAALQDRRLPDALRQYALDWSEQSGVKAQVSLQDERETPIEIEQALFRIAQGALANVARHSQAQNAEIALTYDKDCVRLSISDDGCGFDAARHYPGLGLRAMRERAEMIGAVLVVDSAPGEGTRIEVQCSDST
jgi:NarL family two-component system sensor histidine kinase LiaS